MSIVSKMGFGKKEPYRVPLAVTALRTKIEAENRENFPHLARYKELVREASEMYKILDAEIAKKKYAEEAMKSSADLRMRLDALADKIRKNVQEAKAEGGDDYVESNIDYLARKSVRNGAKTLFTDFLEGQERFTDCLREDKQGCTEVLDASAAAMVRAVAELSEKYFKKHGGDREIADLMEITRAKIADIDRMYGENLLRIREQENAEAIGSYIMKSRATSIVLSIA